MVRDNNNGGLYSRSHRLDCVGNEERQRINRYEQDLLTISQRVSIFLGERGFVYKKVRKRSRADDY